MDAYDDYYLRQTKGDEYDGRGFLKPIVDIAIDKGIEVVGETACRAARQYLRRRRQKRREQSGSGKKRKRRKGAKVPVKRLQEQKGGGRKKKGLFRRRRKPKGKKRAAKKIKKKNKKKRSATRRLKSKRDAKNLVKKACNLTESQTLTKRGKGKLKKELPKLNLLFE